MLTMFLSPEELKDMTGYVRFADQRRWLTDRAWTFEVSGTGRPVVSRAYAENRLGGAVIVPWTPNVSSIKKVA